MNNIPADYTTLKDNHVRLQLDYQILQEKCDRLANELSWFKRQMFGSKSERFVPANNGQTALALGLSAAPEPTPASPQLVESYERKASAPEKKGHGRCPIPAHIKRVDTILEPKEDVTGLVKIGEDITEELEFTPPSFVVNRFIRPKYGQADGSDTVVVAELPPRLIEKGRPGPGLLAQVMLAKFVDHIPLYRQSKQYERVGVPISRSTLCGWTGETSEQIVPVYNLLRQVALDTDYLQADETPILVLEENENPAKKKKDRKKTCISFFWAYSNVVRRIILFDYQDGRGRAGPENVLADFKGILQTDAYQVYESLAKLRNAGKEKPDIILAACLAHVRRKFHDALDNDKTRAEAALAIIKRLYAIEAEAREQKMSAETRHVHRQARGAPVIMAEFKAWLTEQAADPGLLPQSPIGKAVAYALGRWTTLQVYLTDGRLEIDNNLVENAIRPVALGRKNWLFCGSHEGAKRAAMILSLVGTCKLQGIEPFGYLRNLFEKLPVWLASRLKELLPIKS